MMKSYQYALTLLFYFSVAHSTFTWGSDKVILIEKNDNCHQKVVMISGCNRGIGLEIARTLKKEGYILSLGVRNTESIPDDLNNSHVHYFESRDENSAVDWAQSCLDKFGHIDAVVHSAGVLNLWTLYDDESILDNMININLKGTWRLAKATLPSLRKVGNGRFINIVSMAGKRIVQNSQFKPYIGYAISKHAQLALSKGILNEGYDDGVRVTSICSSWVDTDMAKTGPLYEPGQNVTRPQDIADIVSLTLRMPNNAIIDEILITFK